MFFEGKSMYASVAFIPCSRKKLGEPAPAWRFYQGDRFHRGRVYASNVLRVQQVFVLSAKHGLICMGQELEPYDESLEGKSADQLDQWACLVVKQFMTFLVRPTPEGMMRPLKLPERIVVLAEDLYADPLRKYLPMAEYPFAGQSEEEQKRTLMAA